jgi:dTDP-L-rhamnose 4-epimerase
MTESILVTGGAGFIGSHLVDALVEEGHQVRVLDNLEPQVHGSLREQGAWPDYVHPGAEYFLGDVRDRQAMQAAMQDMDVIYHQAAMVGVGQSMYQIERYVDVNTRGTAILLDILANETPIRSRVRKLIVASSMSIYGEGSYICPVHGVVYPRLRTAKQLAAKQWELRCPVHMGTLIVEPCPFELQPRATTEDKPLHATSVYAISKQDQEEMCLISGRAYNVPTVALRYFNTYGPRQALSNPYTGVAAIFLGRLLNGKPPMIYEDGRQTRDFVHVCDIVQANLLARVRDEMDYGVFNVGSGCSVTINEVAKLLIDQLGCHQTPEVAEKYRAGDIRHCVADIGRLVEQGYVPSKTLVEGTVELAAWVQSQQAAESFDAARQELEIRGLAV